MRESQRRTRPSRPACGFRIDSGSRPSRIRSGTCLRTTKRAGSSSAGRCTRPSSTRTIITAGTAPIPGQTIRKAFVREGTYYSEADAEGNDATEPTNSQSYLAHVAARAIILIRADDPVIGLMAFVPIGMSEVSSCNIDSKITPGFHVEKGAELGYFQFGGSTHCLVFRPGAIAEFTLAAIPQPHDPQAPLVLVRSKLATANKTT